MRSALLTLTLLAAPAAAQEPAPYLEAYLQKARDLRATGQLEEALITVQRALERDDRSLTGLSMQAELALQLGDLDQGIHSMHRWLDIVQSQRDPEVTTKERKAFIETLLEHDPEALEWDRMQGGYIKKLVKLGADYKRRKDLIAAIEVYHHVLEVDPNHKAARDAIKEIRRKGGLEVAVEDVFAGADPSFGMTPEQLEEEDRKHADWDNAWRKQTDNYRYRTNAGYLVLETSAIAMEQMNRFYRKFFRYKEDGGKTPKIEVRVFRNRDQYLALGQHPVEWSGGQFTGSAVETYVGGASGVESVRSMYRTLFHEAAHQFVSLTGPVPGWLNEAYASFFEGCVILSNGMVRWNQAPPGRLFPLATRMERGWMTNKDDGVRDGEGGWATPDRAPTLRILVSSEYQWGPPWYAPTWGVVYFLFNYRAEDGRTVYRDALHEYYESFKKGGGADPVERFEEVVLTAPLSPVTRIDDLDEIWREWILELRDRHTGKSDAGDELVRFGDAAVAREEWQAALEFYEEALNDQPSDLDLLEKTAAVLEELGEKGRAAAVYRQLKRELELIGDTEQERYTVAVRKIVQLDPLARRYRELKTNLAERGLQLARNYEERELPTMALEIARRMSANFSVNEALEYYIAVARRTGKTLARWRLAYNEQSLAGWSDSGDAYQAYGPSIRTRVRGEKQGAIVTRQLVCDVPFDADYSLEAQMRFNNEGSWMGLCFGLKGEADFHAVLLHQTGYMDISTNRGNVWDVLDHRSVPVGDSWHRLRVDVTGKTLDVFLDGLYIRSLGFPSPEAVRGSFGLITGIGDVLYRNVRLLARDRYDPAAAVERKLAMERIATDASLRRPGDFSGIAPPELAVQTWVQGDPVTLAALRGRPVFLAFWSPNQDRVIPTAALYAHLAASGQPYDMATVLVCDAGTRPGDLQAHLAEHPIPGAHIGIDVPNVTFDAYYIKQGHHGMPRVLLLDRDGLVTFEGDPGLKSGVGWKAGEATYLDGPLERLLKN